MSPRSTTLTWLVLVALTGGSFALSHASVGRAAGLSILLAALVKASLVASEFMELRGAHVLWRAAFGGLLVLVVAVLAAIQSFA